MNTFKSVLVLGMIFSLAFIASTCTDSATGPDSDMNNGGNDAPESYSQTQRAGFSAADFLSDSSFTTLTIEIDYMEEEHAPTEAAIDSLRSFLEKRLNKSAVTINEPTLIQSGEQASYTASEIRDLEEKHRDLFTENENDQTLTAYIIILNGEYERSKNVIGVAYYNTSVALFGEKIEEVSSSGLVPPPRPKVEASVLNHEFGHLFGLVNIDGSGTEMVNPHQNEENGHHCNNSQCLMYWAVETTNFFANLFEGNIPDLDQNCILDLQANGGK